MVHDSDRCTAFADVEDNMERLVSQGLWNSKLMLWWIYYKVNAKCKLQIGDTLEEFLVQATDDQKLRQVMMSLSEAIRTIAFKVSLCTLDKYSPICSITLQYALLTLSA